MPVYSGPSGERLYDTKFLRIEDLLLVTSPEADLDSTNHSDLAKEVQKDDEVRHLKKAFPDLVDGGYARFFSGSLLITGSSYGYKIPTTSNARAISIGLFREKTPGWNIYDDSKKMERDFEGFSQQHYRIDSLEKLNTLRQAAALFVADRSFSAAELDYIESVRETKELPTEPPLPIPFTWYVNSQNFYEHYGFLGGRHVSIISPLNTPDRPSVSMRKPRI